MEEAPQVQGLEQGCENVAEDETALANLHHGTFASHGSEDIHGFENKKKEVQEAHCTASTMLILSFVPVQLVLLPHFVRTLLVSFG